MGGRILSGNLKYMNLTDSEKNIDKSIDISLYNRCERLNSEYFLNYYSYQDLNKLLKDCGIIGTLKSRHNFKSLYMKTEVNEYDQHTLSIYDESVGDIPLVLIRLREVYFDAFKHFVTGIKLVNVPMIMIDWLTLQNPKKKFTENRQKMLGQVYPGLGLLRQFYKLIRRFYKDLNVKAVLVVPEYFHLAVIYSSAMKFYDPELQGKFESILEHFYLTKRNSITKNKILKFSEYIENEKLFNYITNEVELWHPSEMIYYQEHKGEIYEYFNSPVYKELKETYKEANKYRLLN